jgi:hypothetical protein
MNENKKCHRCDKETYFESKNNKQPAAESCSICSESFCESCVINGRTEKEIEVICIPCAQTNIAIRSRIQNKDDYPALFTGDLKCSRCDTRYFSTESSIKCPNCGCLTLVPELA